MGSARTTCAQTRGVATRLRALHVLSRSAVISGGECGEVTENVKVCEEASQVERERTCEGWLGGNQGGASVFRGETAGVKMVEPDSSTASATPRSSGLFTVRKTRPPIFAPLTSTLSSLTRSGQTPSTSPTPSAPSPLSSSSPSPSTTSAPSPSSKPAPPSGSPSASCPTPPVLPRRPKVDTSLPNFPRRGETLDTSGESGYSTDNSDKESLRSQASGHASIPSLPAPPPPLPRRKPRRKVQFDSYVLLIQALKDRDLKGILSTIFSVSPEALCTEDVIYHFHTALLRQDLEVAELLVRAGAEVNTFDHRGWSALHCAASLARLDMIKLLLMNGAAVLARTHTTGHTPSQLLPPDNPAYTQCLASLACMEECLGTVNNRLTLAAATYKACRADELTISKGDRLFVIRRGDIAENGGGQRMWWWVRNAQGTEGYVLRDLLALNSRHS